MSFHQYIQYKVLDRMYSTDNDALLGMALRNPENEAEIKANFKNVCALISLPLFEDLENICGMLDMTKRKFIEGALVEAISQANKIAEENGLHEHFAMISDHYQGRQDGAIALTATAVEPS
jgi:hypothetical protein